MDPVEHYFRLRENDKSHREAVEHIRLRFGISETDLKALTQDYAAVVQQRLAFLRAEWYLNALND